MQLRDDDIRTDWVRNGVGLNVSADDDGTDGDSDGTDGGGDDDGTDITV